VSVNNLGLAGGTTTLTANTTLAGSLSGSGTLATQGNLSITPQAMAFSGQLNVASGNLTINAPASSIPPGALARYSFDNAANLGADSMGSANGTPLSNNGGALPTQVPGKIGGAVDLSQPSQDYISLPAGFDDFTKGITVSAWVNYASFTNWNRVIDFGTGAGANNILLARIGGGADIRWELWNTAGGTMSQTVGGGPLQNNQWHHVVATYDPTLGSNQRKIYIDGVVRNQDSPTELNAQPINFNIGVTNNNEFFNGYLDEMLIYNRALSASDVTGLYQAGIGGGYSSLGNLTMAPGTSLAISGSAASFESIKTLGATTTITGAVVAGGPVTIGSSPGTLNVVGKFAMGAGSTYKWETLGSAPGQSDLIAVSGSPGDLDLTGPWTLAITPLAPVKGGTYDLFTYTGVLTGSAPYATLARGAGAYADLVNLPGSSITTSAGSPNKVSLSLAMNNFTQWKGVGTTAWNDPGNWDNGAPGPANAAIVNAAGPVATVNVPVINVTGGTTSGTVSDSPGKVGTTLPASTTLLLNGGTLAGTFTSLNSSATPGSYAYEVQGGVSNAILKGDTALLHVRSTAGTAAINGPVYLNTMSVEGGTTAINDNDVLRLNTLTVSGGSLAVNRPARIGTMGLAGGTTTTTRGMTVTSGLRGGGTLIADGLLDLFSNRDAILPLYPPSRANRRGFACRLGHPQLEVLFAFERGAGPPRRRPSLCRSGRFPPLVMTSVGDSDWDAPRPPERYRFAGGLP